MTVFDKKVQIITNNALRTKKNEKNTKKEQKKDWKSPEKGLKNT